MKAHVIPRLDAIRERLEEDLGFTEPLRELASFAEALEPREATRERLRGIRTATTSSGKKVKIKSHAPSKMQRRSDRKRFRAARKLGPGEKMVFGKVVKSSIDPETTDALADARRHLEANGAEQVACAASGALNLKKGEKGDKKKLAKEIAKRTKSKKLARAAMKKAQEF